MGPGERCSSEGLVEIKYMVSGESAHCRQKAKAGHVWGYLGGLAGLDLRDE